MKSLIIAGAASVIVAATFNHSFASTLSPPGTSFAAVGGISVSGQSFGYGCLADLKGKVNKSGVGEITFAKFENGGNCLAYKDIQPVGLPWKFKATGTGEKAKLIDVAVTVTGTPCGPSTIPVRITSKGIISFENVAMAGGCTINGSLRTRPPITTVP